MSKTYIKARNIRVKESKVFRPCRHNAVILWIFFLRNVQMEVAYRRSPTKFNFHAKAQSANSTIKH